jgi:hypothetical protein
LTSWPIATARPCSRSALGWRNKHKVASARQAISHHLWVLLDEAGLIGRRRDGRCRLYLDSAPIERIAQRWRRPK